MKTISIALGLLAAAVLAGCGGSETTPKAVTAKDLPALVRAAPERPKADYKQVRAAFVARKDTAKGSIERALAFKSAYAVRWQDFPTTAEALALLFRDEAAARKAFALLRRSSERGITRVNENRWVDKWVEVDGDLGDESWAARENCRRDGPPCGFTFQWRDGNLVFSAALWNHQTTIDEDDARAYAEAIEGRAAG